MRSTPQDIQRIAEIIQIVRPEKVKMQFGTAVNMPAAANFTVTFDKPFTQLPTVLFSVSVAWNAPPGCRLVSLGTTGFIVVADSAGTLYWMALGY